MNKITLPKSTMPRSPNHVGTAAAPVTRVDGVRRIASKDLLGGQGELMIEHQGRLYRLRVTQNDKLILTA